MDQGLYLSPTYTKERGAVQPTGEGYAPVCWIDGAIAELVVEVFVDNHRRRNKRLEPCERSVMRVSKR